MASLSAKTIRRSRLQGVKQLCMPFYVNYYDIFSWILQTNCPDQVGRRASIPKAKKCLTVKSHEVS